MSHLSQETIGRYLDGDLAAAELSAADAHLAACPACRAELAATAGLFAELAALPPEPPPFDLSPAVVARVAPPTRWGARAWALLAAQAALCLALALPLAPLLLAAASGLGDMLAGMAPPLAPGAPASWLAELGGSSARLAQTLAIPLPAPLEGLGAGGWALLIGAAALAWLAGNRYLLGGLREPPATEREGNR